MHPRVEGIIRPVREMTTRLRDRAVETIVFKAHSVTSRTTSIESSKPIENEQVKPLEAVAIIPDGNRRWAVSHGMKPEEGMAEGAEAMLRLFPAFVENPDIKTIYAWAFSTDNWNRPKEQIDAVMNVVEKTIVRAMPLFDKYQIRFKRLGKEDRIREEYPSLWQTMLDTEQRTEGYKNKRFGLLLDFGGEDQDLRIARKIKEMSISNPDLEITQELIESLRDGYEEGFRPADAVVRTSGEMRTSGIGWIGDMAEFISIEHNLPDSNTNDGTFVIEEFATRQRRFGK